MFSISELKSGINNQLKYTIQSNDNLHSCDIYIYGCTITSWKNNQIEKLFLSSTTPFDGIKPIRGGIPIVFPQFGTITNSKLPQHGFARTSIWNLLIDKTIVSNSSIQVTFELTENENTLLLFPYKFTLHYVITLTEISLDMKLIIHNTDIHDFNFHALLHTYLSIPSISSLLVEGFNNCNYYDKLLPIDNNIMNENNKYISIQEEVDRIYYYQLSFNNIYLLNKVISTNNNNVDDLTLNKKMLTIFHEAYYDKNNTNHNNTNSNNNIISHDCVLWNAWIDKCKCIIDLEDNDYLRYICVEPGIVSQFYPIKSNEKIVLHQCLII